MHENRGLRVSDSNIPCLLHRAVGQFYSFKVYPYDNLRKSMRRSNVPLENTFLVLDQLYIFIASMQG